jgi:hypothetical protein
MSISINHIIWDIFFLYFYFAIFFVYYPITNAIRAVDFIKMSLKEEIYKYDDCLISENFIVIYVSYFIY